MILFNLSLIFHYAIAVRFSSALDILPFRYSPTAVLEEFLESQRFTNYIQAKPENLQSLIDIIEDELHKDKWINKNWKFLLPKLRTMVDTRDMLIVEKLHAKAQAWANVLMKGKKFNSFEFQSFLSNGYNALLLNSKIVEDIDKIDYATFNHIQTLAIGSIKRRLREASGDIDDIIRVLKLAVAMKIAYQLEDYRTFLSLVVDDSFKAFVIQKQFSEKDGILYDVLKKYASRDYDNVNQVISTLTHLTLKYHDISKFSPFRKFIENEDNAMQLSDKIAKYPQWFKIFLDLEYDNFPELPSKLELLAKKPLSTSPKKPTNKLISERPPNIKNLDPTSVLTKKLDGRLKQSSRGLPPRIPGRPVKL